MTPIAGSYQFTIAQRAELIDLAKMKSKMQILSERYTPCESALNNCAGDTVTEYAMPNGTIRIIRTHAYKDDAD